MASEIEKKLEEFNRKIAKAESSKEQLKDKKAGALAKIEEKRVETVKDFDEKIGVVDKEITELTSKKAKVEKMIKQQNALLAMLADDEEEKTEKQETSSNTPVVENTSSIFE